MVTGNCLQLWVCCEMKYITFAFLAFWTAQTMAFTPPRIKALWNLERMGECRLGYNPLVYSGYGCWCGPGGDGTPVDDIDTCCMRHDKCYDEAVNSHACSNVPWEYVRDYDWSCVDNEAICNDGMSDCQAALCACDKMVVDCWGQYPKPSNSPDCPN